MSRKKLQKKITQGLLDARISEKTLQRQIKKIKKAETKFLLEVKQLIDNKNIKEARLMAINIIDSRKTIQKLGKMRIFLFTIQSHFREAQTAILKGEAIETIVSALGSTNQLLAADSIDAAFVQLEAEVETLSDPVTDGIQLLEEFEDPLEQEDEYVDNIIEKLGKVSKDNINDTINELLDIKGLLPPVPKSSDAVKSDILQ